MFCRAEFWRILTRSKTRESQTTNAVLTETHSVEVNVRVIELCDRYSVHCEEGRVFSRVGAMRSHTLHNTVEHTLFLVVQFLVDRALRGERRFVVGDGGGHGGGAPHAATRSLLDPLAHDVDIWHKISRSGPRGRRSFRVRCAQNEVRSRALRNGRIPPLHMLTQRHQPRTCSCLRTWPTLVGRASLPQPALSYR